MCARDAAADAAQHAGRAERVGDLLLGIQWRAGGHYHRGHQQCAGAGGAAHLPGMLASKTEIPVLGVPIHTKYLKGRDSLISIVQMPKGIPVATFAIGESGATNAALFAISLLSNNDKILHEKLLDFRESQKNKVINTKLK